MDLEGYKLYKSLGLTCEEKDQQVRIALNAVCPWSGACRGRGPLCPCLGLLSEIVYPLSETCGGCGGGKGTLIALQQYK